MSWILAPAHLSVVAILLIFLQGASLRHDAIRHDNTDVRWFGIAMMLLAGLALVVHALVFGQALVLSPEFGELMVQGQAAWVGSWLLIVGLMVLLGIGLHFARCASGCPSRAGTLISVGFLIGTIECFMGRPLNGDAPTWLRVYAYDLLSPVFLGWLVFCLLGSAMAVLQLMGGGRGRLLLLAGLSALQVLLLWHSQRITGAWLSITIGLVVALYLATPHGRHRFGGMSGVAARMTWPWRDGRRWPWIRVSLVAAIGIFALSFVDQFVLGSRLPAVLMYLSLVLIWLLASEEIANGLLHDLRVLLVKALASLARTPPLFWLGAAGRWLRDLPRVGARVLRQLVRASPSGASLWLLTGIGIAVLIAIGDIPHRGKTILEPFESPGSPKHGLLGRGVSDRLLGELNLMRDELRPRYLLPNVIEEKKAKQYMPVVELEGVTSEVIPAGTPLRIGNLDLPLSALFAPIRDPIRRLLGISVIRGIVMSDERRLRVFASSSRGDSWTEMAELPRGQGSDSSAALVDSLQQLVERLALRIVGSERSAGARGMTGSREAFEKFRKGQAFMKELEKRDGDLAFADSAVAAFREAVAADLNFSLARYRLGLALLADREPRAGERELRQTIRLQPEFVPAYMALALALLSPEQFYPPQPAVCLARPPSSTAEEDTEGRELCGTVLRLHHSSRPDRVGAYYWLCRDAYLRVLDERAIARNDATVPATAGELAKREQLTFYLGKQTLRRIAALPPEVRSDSRIVVERSQIAWILGRVLSNEIEAPAKDEEWHCRPVSLSLDGGGAVRAVRRHLAPLRNRVRSAIRYFRDAAELEPEYADASDDFADVAQGAGDNGPMKRLRGHENAHLRLVTQYLEFASAAEESALVIGYYTLASKELTELDRVKRASADELNNAAYAVWRASLAARDSAHTWRTPPVELIERGEMWARAAADSGALGSPAERGVRLGTLGEVLLAAGRAREAADVQRKALKLVPEHWYFNEMRWDLAQAYLCMAEREPDRTRYWRDKASKHLMQIQQSEVGREYAPFSDEPRLLDPALRPRCGPPGHFAEHLPWSKPDLELDEPILQRDAARRWLVVQVSGLDSRGQPLGSEFWIHIWGGGVTRWARFDTTPAGNRLVVSPDPATTKNYYFVQVWRETSPGRGYPVSRALSFRTDSVKSLTTLVFREATRATPAP